MFRNPHHALLPLRGAADLKASPLPPAPLSAAGRRLLAACCRLEAVRLLAEVAANSRDPEDLPRGREKPDPCWGSGPRIQRTCSGEGKNLIPGRYYKEYIFQDTRILGPRIQRICPGEGKNLIPGRYYKEYIVQDTRILGPRIQSICPGEGKNPIPGRYYKEYIVQDTRILGPRIQSIDRKSVV